MSLPSEIQNLQLQLSGLTVVDDGGVRKASVGKIPLALPSGISDCFLP